MKINKCGCGDYEVYVDLFDEGYSANCTYCGNCSAYYNTEEDAIQAWNTAHPDIDELKAELETYKKAWWGIAGYLSVHGFDVNKLLAKAKEDK